MPLSDASLKSRLKTEIAELFTIEDQTILDKACEAIAKAVVDEIKANALVTGTVTSGGGSGGNVTGTVS